MKPRARLSSRLGFIFISAGCAIGLGNVYRFPYITAQYGGAVFIIIYLIFLFLMGVPVMTMEFSVGRASQQSAVRSFEVLRPEKKRWRPFGWVGLVGNCMLMMSYTTISGWMLSFFVKMLSGQFVGQDPTAIAQTFANMQANPVENIVFMAIVVLLGFGVCALGVNKGVERISKFIMSALLVIMLVLVIRSVTLPGAAAGLEFYLKPDFSVLLSPRWGEVVFAAMGQAFFTLSIGMGSMAIFGSYLGRDRRLMGESVSITLLDTFVALMAGLIVIPACFAFGVDPNSGMKLIFITLPNIFNQMPGGQIWGSIFFLFMLFAAMTTVIAVFENIVCMIMDRWHWSRKKAISVGIAALFLLSLPAALSFNLLSGVQPMGAGSNLLTLEDFIVSNNILPLGSLVYVLFCTRKCGWGYQNFLQEANLGVGLKFPEKLRLYVSYVLPLLIVFVFVQGYFSLFAA